MTTASSIDDNGSSEVDAYVCVPIAYNTHESMPTSTGESLLSFPLGMLVSTYVNVLTLVFSAMISSCWLVLLTTTSVLLLVSYLVLRYVNTVAILLFVTEDDDDGDTGGCKDKNKNGSWDTRVPIILFGYGFVIGNLIFVGLSDASPEAIIIAYVSPFVVFVVLAFGIIIFDMAKAKGKLDPRIPLGESHV
jgi:hypothetical protein